jgi:hypothetical protein
VQTHADELKRQIAMASKYRPVLTEYLQALSAGKKALHKIITPEFAQRLSRDPKHLSQHDRVTVKIWEIWEGTQECNRALVVKGIREHPDRVELWLEEKLKLAPGKQPSQIKVMTLVWERKQTWQKTPQGWRLAATEKAKPPASVLFNAQLRISLPSTDRV